MVHRLSPCRSVIDNHPESFIETLTNQSDRIGGIIRLVGLIGLVGRFHWKDDLVEGTDWGEE